MKRRDFLLSSTAIASTTVAIPLAGCGGGGEQPDSPQAPVAPTPAPPPLSPSPAPSTGRTYQFGAAVRSQAELAAVPTVYAKASAPGVALPRSADLRTSGFLPPVGDQGNQPSCVAWAVGYTTATFSAAQQAVINPTSPARQASPTDLYAKLQQIRPTSCRDGTLITDACDILIRDRITTLQDAPYSDRSCPAPRANRQFGILGYRRLNSADSQAIKTQIYEKKPLPIGMRVYSDFVSFGTGSLRTGIYRISGSLTNEGHAMAIVGYDDDRQAYLVVNSWGVDWGNQGYFWFDYNSFQSSVFEVYAVDGAAQANVVPSPGPAPSPSPSPAPTTLQIRSLTATSQINFFYGLDVLFLEFSLSEPVFINAVSFRYEDAFGFGYFPFQSQSFPVGVWAAQSYVNFWQSLPSRWVPGRYTLFMDCTRQNSQSQTISSSTLFR
ncbi:C1 family peptidase [Paucibacter sp. M5-1]|uniref:C1 family peptidase n=1 Tax=Paucibacter sp. M5-1 TaxID=3015998 RepID=UPI0022B8A6EA|nr:C1 family peptidase [Paucibacter sp. M5-1]MCZ7881539.1 hypothetical protein [Paucibacter sp. M5-1]